MELTNMHMARGFSDLHHAFARKQCILCPALRHGCLTLLYVTWIQDFFCPWKLPRSLVSSRGASSLAIKKFPSKNFILA